MPALCQLCGEEAKLVKAHIVPKSFYEIPSQATGEVMKVVSNVPGFHPAVSRQGIYDPNILCQACEDSFSECDGYAAHLLIQSMSGFVNWTLGPFNGYIVPKFRYSLLKRFFLSLLWRSAVSDMAAFSRVQLTATTLEQLRFMLVEGKAGNADEFAVNLHVYNDEPAAAMFISPVPREQDGIAYYRFKLHRYVAYIKIDQRPHAGVLREFQLSALRSLVIVRNEWTGSGDFKAAQRIAIDLHKRGVRVFNQDGRSHMG